MRVVMERGELIRDAGHCSSVGCHREAGWKVVYNDKSYAYLCDHHATEEAKIARKAARRG